MPRWNTSIGAALRKMPSRFESAILEACQLLDKNKDRLPVDFYEQMGYKLRRLNLVNKVDRMEVYMPNYPEGEDYSEAD